ncbi:MBOAT family O-acyltransferase [Larkinella terrae]|uniref:MBOAT family protein n=1 Tax=Larkinella terrae TaxID=2025311 RepID=A0A7K0EVF1_9BACT|nr:MBOAT family O-acyltransferase [Larkinella terrae]MRS65536.1 MBOAT family protein [Larkinella terrae]
MLFNSIQFLIFFPVVTTLYFALPQRFRWVLLLVASCYFYMAFIPVYILILLFTILIDYFAGILIEQSVGKRRKQLLAVSIVANVGVLAVFKYYNFFIGDINAVLGLTGASQLSYWNLILPIGLSFHTFQAMSYTIEVYRGNYPAERHLGYYALYVLYYPQLVAGPIERPQNVIHQFKTKHEFDYQRVVDGLKLMAYGFFKKIVIADNLAAYVDSYYAGIHTGAGLEINSLVAVALFPIQIYCDFSGYSDIALGASRVMGIELMKNFNFPLFSHSVTEYWRRWHLSLSTWFRDYLYFSLGGNKKHRYRNVMIVFLTSGLWHGANWTYVIWGAIHGCFQILEDLLNLRQNKGFIPFLGTTIVISLAFIFFRSTDLSMAFQVFANMVSPHFDWHNPLLSKKIMLVTALFLAGEYWLSQRDYLPALNGLRKPLRYGLYYALILAVIFLGRFGTGNQFIYFQF